jgi:hypothetical protein
MDLHLTRCFLQFIRNELVKKQLRNMSILRISQYLIVWDVLSSDPGIYIWDGYERVLFLV